MTPPSGDQSTRPPGLRRTDREVTASGAAEAPEAAQGTARSIPIVRKAEVRITFVGAIVRGRKPGHLDSCGALFPRALWEVSRPGKGRRRRPSAAEEEERQEDHRQDRENQGQEPQAPADPSVGGGRGRDLRHGYDTGLRVDAA